MRKTLKNFKTKCLSRSTISLIKGGDTYTLFVDKGNGYEARSYSSLSAYNTFRNLFLSSGYSVSKFGDLPNLQG